MQIKLGQQDPCTLTDRETLLWVYHGSTEALYTLSGRPAGQKHLILCDYERWNEHDFFPDEAYSVVSIASAWLQATPSIREVTVRFARDVSDPVVWGELCALVANLPPRVTRLAIARMHQRAVEGTGKWSPPVVPDTVHELWLGCIPACVIPPRVTNIVVDVPYDGLVLPKTVTSAAFVGTEGVHLPALPDGLENLWVSGGFAYDAMLPASLVQLVLHNNGGAQTGVRGIDDGFPWDGHVPNKSLRASFYSVLEKIPVFAPVHPTGSSLDVRITGCIGSDLSLLPARTRILDLSGAVFLHLAVQGKGSPWHTPDDCLLNGTCGNVINNSPSQCDDNEHQCHGYCPHIVQQGPRFLTWRSPLVAMPMSLTDLYLPERFPMPRSGDYPPRLRTLSVHGIYGAADLPASLQRLQVRGPCVFPVPALASHPRLAEIDVERVESSLGAVAWPSASLASLRVGQGELESCDFSNHRALLELDVSDAVSPPRSLPPSLRVLRYHSVRPADTGFAAWLDGKPAPLLRELHVYGAPCTFMRWDPPLESYPSLERIYLDKDTEGGTSKARMLVWVEGFSASSNEQNNNTHNTHNTTNNTATTFTMLLERSGARFPTRGISATATLVNDTEKQQGADS